VFWPARFGHSGFTLLPLVPWQAWQVAATAAPASAEPSGHVAGAANMATAQQAIRIDAVMVLSVPRERGIVH